MAKKTKFILGSEVFSTLDSGILTETLLYDTECRVSDGFHSEGIVITAPLKIRQ